MNKLDRMRHNWFLAFLRGVPRGRIVTIHEIEGGTGIYGYDLLAEIDRALDVGVIEEVTSGETYRKLDYFQY